MTIADVLLLNQAEKTLFILLKLILNLFALLNISKCKRNSFIAIIIYYLQQGHCPDITSKHEFKFE